MSETPQKANFPKPKVLLVDMAADVLEAVTAAGFNARAGTFGRPFKVPVSDRFVPVFTAARLPNYSEQEVIVIDLTPPPVADEPPNLDQAVAGERDWFAKCSRGEIDPRPRVMACLQENGDRVLEAGGVFVVFARPRLIQHLVFGETRFGNLEVQRDIRHDNWSFLSVLGSQHVEIDGDYGMETAVCKSLPIIESFIKRHQAEMEFDCTLRPLHLLSGEGGRPGFFPLIKNKYGGTVGGIVFCKQGKKGKVVILPQMRAKSAAVVELLQTILPELSPHLFPFAEGGQWVRRSEYEHPGVLERRTRQDEIQREAAANIAQLEREIESERAALHYLHGLLTNSGDKLVADVKAALEAAGFKQVLNVDEAEAGSAAKQEDLQVHDRSPALLVEIKGLAGQPTESDTLQVTKYVLRRMRQWDRTDVQGLSLINHQRNLPALARDHGNVFTAPQVQDADQNGTGLMTTWDLFRLVRGKSRWGWPAQAVCDVFFRTGRILPIPAHYAPVGKVAKFWPDHGVASVDIEGERPLKVGDRVGFLLPAGFHEEEVTSLQVNKVGVREAFPGQRAGHKTVLGKVEVPVGTQVFRVGR